ENTRHDSYPFPTFGSFLTRGGTRPLNPRPSPDSCQSEHQPRPIAVATRPTLASFALSQTKTQSTPSGDPNATPNLVLYGFTALEEEPHRAPAPSRVAR